MGILSFQYYVGKHIGSDLAFAVLHFMKVVIPFHKTVIMFYVDAPPFVHPSEDKLGAKEVVEITFITFSKYFLLSFYSFLVARTFYFMCFPFQIKPIVTKKQI